MYTNDAYLNCRQCKSAKSSTFNCFFKVNGSTSFINLNITSNKALDDAGIYGYTILSSGSYKSNIARLPSSSKIVLKYKIYIPTVMYIKLTIVVVAPFQIE